MPNVRGLIFPQVLWLSKKPQVPFGKLRAGFRLRLTQMRRTSLRMTSFRIVLSHISRSRCEAPVEGKGDFSRSSALVPHSSKSSLSGPPVWMWGTRQAALVACAKGWGTGLPVLGLSAIGGRV